MKLLSLLEPEEHVGGLWHRLVGNKASWPEYPQASVNLDDVRSRLATFFRGIGGESALQFAVASRQNSPHRLTLRQRFGMEVERIVSPYRDDTHICLPQQIALFPVQTLNADLFYWLAAWFAEMPAADTRNLDGLEHDIARLRAAQATTKAILDRFPGLANRYRALSQATIAARPHRSLPALEAEVEKVTLALLADPNTPLPDFSGRKSRNYKPFLPVPLWGEWSSSSPGQAPEDSDEAPGPAGKEEEGQTRHKAERRQQDNADRTDPLILNRFEKILAMADMVNVNRGADDADEEEARKAADDSDKMVLARHSRRPATRLKFDLDLSPTAVDPRRLTGSYLLPEWDWRSSKLLPDHCQIHVGPGPEEGEPWLPGDDIRRRIRAVKRQFEALRTRPAFLHGQTDGQEIDTDAAVRSQSDLMASGIGSDRLWIDRRSNERDLAVMVLVDASLSTDAWFENRRVLDVEKEALMIFSHGLAACGDAFSIATFTSRKRNWVKIDEIKAFDDAFDAAALRRISAIRPGYYTRMGAAIRHATRCLDARHERHKLLLLLTDGKPNDVDHYEGRYGVMDTRKAVIEARASGQTVFGITIDRRAQEYFPILFGRGHFAIVNHIAQLSSALPRIYRQLIA